MPPAQGCRDCQTAKAQRSARGKSQMGNESGCAGWIKPSARQMGKCSHRFYRAAVLSTPAKMPREIITLQVGQCGNQSTWQHDRLCSQPTRSLTCSLFFISLQLATSSGSAYAWNMVLALKDGQSLMRQMLLEIAKMSFSIKYDFASCASISHQFQTY